MRAPRPLLVPMDRCLDRNDNGRIDTAMGTEPRDGDDSVLDGISSDPEIHYCVVWP